MVDKNLFLNLFRSKPVTQFVTGQTIVDAGTTGQSMYVVVEGEVNVQVREKAIDTLAAGSIFGEMSLIDDAPRSATVIAKTDCKLVEVDRKRFEYLVSETPYFALAVMRVMADRLRKANTSAMASDDSLSTVS